MIMETAMPVCERSMEECVGRLIIARHRSTTAVADLKPLQQRLLIHQCRC